LLLLEGLLEEGVAIRRVVSSTADHQLKLLFLLHS